MPPKKKFARTVGVSLTPFEAELLEFLVAEHGGSYSSHLREALWEHGKRVLTSGLVDQLSDKFEPTMVHGRASENEDDRRVFLADLERFCSEAPAHPDESVPAWSDDILGAELEPFSSTDDDFKD